METTEYILMRNDSVKGNERFGPDIQDAIFISITSLIGILLISSVTLNILTIVSVRKFKRLQIPANYILVNLSVADCGASLASVIYVVSSTVLEGEEAACLSSVGFVFVTFSATLLSLALVAYDRFSALVKPLTYSSRLTHQRIMLYITFIWMYAIAVTVVSLCTMLFGTSMLEMISSDIEQAITSCDSNGSLAPSAHSDLLCISGMQVNSAIIFQIAFIFVPGALVMFYCYGRVMVVARHHSKAISAVQGNLNKSKFNKTYGMFRGKKYFVTLTSILGEFLFTWGAFVTLTFLDIFCTDCLQSHFIPHSYICTLALVPLGVNPWIYACRSQDFKAAYLRLYKTARQCYERESSPTNHPRRDSRFSDGLSRTNSIVGNMQHLQALYNDIYHKQKGQSTDGMGCCAPAIELPTLSRTVHTAQPKADTIQALVPD